MTTLPPPGTNEFSDSSIEKKVYRIVESFGDYIPVSNDKNRLGFGLYKYITGEGDPPETLLKSAKIKIEGITLEDLAAKIKTKLEEVKQ